MSATVQRRKLNYADVDAAIADVQSLRKGYVKSGNWDLPQICWHLTSVLDRTSRPATEPATAEQIKMQPIKEQILATGRLPDRQIQAPEIVVPPADCGEDSIDQFIAALHRLAAYSEKSAVHRLWGPLSVSEFQRLSLIHCAHHLSHLTANT